MRRRFATTVMTVFLAWAGTAAQSTTRYVNNDINCVNSALGGSEALPLCTMAYVETLSATGVEYVFDSTRDLSGPAEFDRVATEANPIIYRSRNNTYLGMGIDINDAAFVPTSDPGVFSLTGGPVAGRVWATHFVDVEVEDPNGANFVMNSLTGGPIEYISVPTTAELLAHEGSYNYNATTGVLRVHTFGNVTPSVGATDLVMAQNTALNFSTSTTWVTMDGFRIAFLGSVNSFKLNGSRNTLQNLQLSGIPLSIRGGSNTARNIRVAHMINRQADGDWSWTYKGEGTAATITGPSHRLYNIETMHSWNAGISGEAASLTSPPIIDGAKSHGAPNHCMVSNVGAAILRNIILYNCQGDYQRTNSPQGMVIEHMTLHSSLPLEATVADMGAFTIRNSTIPGNIHFIQGPFDCNLGGLRFENVMFSTTSTIERCEGGTPTISAYIAACAAGTYTNCATFVNPIFVAPTAWGTVFVGGLWGPSKGDVWVPIPVEGGPAHNAGMASSTAVDVAGNERPQGSGPDIGAYEFVEDISDAFYVDNSCANNGNGGAHTCASSGGALGAFNALQVALDAATSPGDTVFIKNGSGTYVTTTGSRGQGVELDSGFAITHSGTEANPITVRNYEGHSPLIANCADGVTDYTNCARLTFSAWCQEGVRITGLRIRGSVGLRCNTTTEVTLKRWNEVDHNEITVGFDVFDGVDWAGVALSNQRFWQVHHNYIHAIAPMTNSGSQTSSSGLKLYTAVDGVAEYNTIKDGVTSGAGGIDDKVDTVRNTHRYNWMENVDTCLRFQFAVGPGPYTTGTGSAAYQNVCIGRVGSVQPLWRVSTGALTDVTVYNNVFYRGPRGLRIDATTGSTDGIRHYNNIYELIATDNVQSLFTTTDDIDLEDYNTYDPDANYIAAGVTYTSLAAYMAAVPARNANSGEAACTFVNAGSDFHLPSGACVGTGRVGGVSSGAAIDRGAYVNGIRCVGNGCGPPTGVK